MMKPLKRWSVNAVSEGHAPLALFCEAHPVPTATAAVSENLSPIQYLLLSVASCFALSCRAELKRRKLGNIAFEVVVMGDKEIGSADNLLSVISIVAIFGGGITEPMAREITARAKPLCTVTNTLLDSPKIRFKSRALTPWRNPPPELPGQLAVQ